MQKKLLTLIVALLTGSAAFPQIHKMEKNDSSLTDRTYNLNPVVVTGSGHHQRLKSTATPVHVLSAQEIREQGIANFGDALTRMLPQVSMAPNSMGTFLRLNGLGNKYILILINGQKLSGDISNNVDLSRINMSRIKRIEILDGAASSLYGSDAIGGVINSPSPSTLISTRMASAPIHHLPTTEPTVIKTKIWNISRVLIQRPNRRLRRCLRAIAPTSSDRNSPTVPISIWL